MFNSILRVLYGWSIYGAICLVTIMSRSTFCEIKQVVREWAEFSYKATFICMFLKNNNCWPFLDVQLERSNKLTVHEVYLFVAPAGFWPQRAKTRGGIY